MWGRSRYLEEERRLIKEVGLDKFRKMKQIDHVEPRENKFMNPTEVIAAIGIVLRDGWNHSRVVFTMMVDVN